MGGGAADRCAQAGRARADAAAGQEDRAPAAAAQGRDAQAGRRADRHRAREARGTEAQEEQRREDELKRQKEEQQRKLAEAEKLKKEQAEQKKREAAEAAAAQAQRQKQLERMAALAGDGAPNATGTAAKSAGPSASYAGRIKARILPNIVFPDSVSGNPQATVEVKAGPDGTIIGRRLLKSSGVPAWDEAVLRAIDKTEVLPRDTDGRVPSSFEISFRPRD